MTPSSKRFRLACYGVLFVAVVLKAGSAAAVVRELKPVLVRRTCTEGFADANQIGGYWSDHGRTSGNVTWLKFEIPKFPGERIVKATLAIGPVAQFNHPWDAGIQVHYVQADDWTAESIDPGRPTTDRRAANRSPHDKGGTAAGRLSTDVTGWLSLDDEGQGRSLSVRLSHTGGGLRGWLAKEPTTLTLTTERLISFGRPKRPAKGPGGLAVRSSLTTAFAEEAPDPEPSPAISLSAARRESESALIVVIAGEAPVRITDVQAGALAAADGGSVIAAKNVTTELVGYVAIRRNSWRGRRRAGVWPDVLMPMRRFEVPRGQCASCPGARDQSPRGTC